MRLSLCLVTSLLAVGCTDSGSGSVSGPDQTELDNARTSFGTASSAYSFLREESCECTQEFAARMYIEVVNERITNALYRETEEAVPQDIIDALMTVEDAFVAIQDAINNDLPFEVTYDGEFGYPTSLYIDRIPEAVDDELSLTMSNFEPLAVAWMRPSGGG